MRLRLLTDADLVFADSLRELVGWNQTLLDWQRFLATEPGGCFLVEWNGRPAGTATTTIYSQNLGWIGMVLVHPDYRRRGLGRALLHHCITYLRDCGVRCIKLDATPLGLPVYQSLGFQEEWTLKRWVAPSSAAPAAEATRSHQMGASRDESSSKPSTPEPAAPGTHGEASTMARLRPWRATDLVPVDLLDSAAFGESRQRLLTLLARQSQTAFVLESGSGRIEGHGLLRLGAQARYLGPVVAASPQAGLDLVEALLAPCQGQQVFWDIPDPNLAARTWAEEHGFTVQRPLTRMFLGDNLAAGDPTKQFALAGPEVG